MGKKSLSAEVKSMFANAETLAELKSVYLNACKEYMGTGSMGEVNGLWKKYFAEVKTLNKTKEGVVYEKATSEKYGDFQKAIKAILGIKGLAPEMCGSWLWVNDAEGCEGTMKENRELLKEVGCHYAPNKKNWYIAPPNSKRSRKHYSMEEIRAMHGSEEVEA